MTRMAWFSLEACRAQALRAAREGQGAVLPLTLIILLILAALVTALLATGITEPQIASNVVRGNQALSLAEAGAERAVAYFLVPTNLSLVGCAMASPSENGCAAPTPTGTPAASCDGGGSCTQLPPIWGGVGVTSCGGSGNPCGDAQGLANLGTYTVTYRPISFATLLITSTGRTSAGNAQRTVRVVVTQYWQSKFGVLGKDVTVSGTARVQGTAGAVQGNNSLSVGGSSSIALTATSNTTCATCCSGCTGGNVGQPQASGTGKPYAPIPTATPASVLTQAQSTNQPPPPAPNPVQIIILGPAPGIAGCPAVPAVPSGKILNVQPISSALGIPLLAACTLSNPGAPVWTGWSQDPITLAWSLPASAPLPPDGVYYTPQAINLTGPAAAAGTWNATLLSGDSNPQNGTVTIAGKPTINPYFNSLLTVAGTVSVAGTGSGGPILGGTVFATGTTAPCTPLGNGNLSLSGNFTLTGNIVSSGCVTVTGNPSITYSPVPTRSRVLSPTLQILSWSTT